MLSRRGFLGASAAAVAPMILPQGVLAAGGRPGANDRVITAHVGVGGQGNSHLRAWRDNCGGICEVDETRLSEAASYIGRDVELVKDYRYLLDRNDIDAVVIATPDHWHAKQTVDACEAGKDVYVEKPACNTVEEGKAMVDAARRYGRVVQVGSQGRSQAFAHLACTFIRNGQLGDVNKVECWHYPNEAGGDPALYGPAPDYLDWDLWLGPAQWQEYNPDFVHWNFRWFLDFGGGNIRDRGAHVLSLVDWFLDLDFKNPIKVTCTGTAPETGIYNCPTQMEAVWEFQDPKLTLVWAQPGNEASDHGFGAVYHGSDRSLVVSGGDGGGTVPDKDVTEYVAPADGVHPFRSKNHHQNFMDCVKSRELPIMDIEAGVRVANVCNLGNMAYKLGRTLEWDPVTQEFINDAQANRMQSRPGRGPWHV
jgi:predicted dehydrogenase